MITGSMADGFGLHVSVGVETGLAVLGQRYGDFTFFSILLKTVLRVETTYPLADYMLFFWTG